MTRIDLPKSLCAQLADYLRSRLQAGIAGNYQLVELLVLSARALADAEECSGGVFTLPDIPAAETQKPAAEQVLRGAAAAQFKRDTLARLEAYRRTGTGIVSLEPLARLCKPVDGKPVGAILLQKMLNRERIPVAVWRSVAAALDEMDMRNGEKGEADEDE